MKISSWRFGVPQGVAVPAMIALVVAMVTTGALVLGGGQARAAGVAVAVGSPSNRFSPNVTNITVGESVTFNWAEGTHIVDFKDVSPDMPIDAGHKVGTTMAFDHPGTFYYYCSIHATEALATEAHVQANDAMVGKIVVTAGQMTPTTTATTPVVTSSVGGSNTPGAPSTGSGVRRPNDDGTLLAIALISGSVMLLVGATAFAVRK